MLTPALRSTALEITVDADLLILSGRLDAAGAIALDSWKADATTIPALWDLRALAFLSSLGIRSLITLDRRVRAAGQRVQVVYVAESFVADVLTAAGLTKQWSMHTDIVAARAAGHSVASPTRRTRPRICCRCWSGACRSRRFSKSNAYASRWRRGRAA